MFSLVVGHEKEDSPEEEERILSSLGATFKSISLLDKNPGIERQSGIVGIKTGKCLKSTER